MGPALVAAGLTGSDVAVWHALRAHLAYRGSGWPSQAQLVAASGCSVSTVVRAVRRLVEARFLDVRRLRRGERLPNDAVVFAAERLVYELGPRACAVIRDAAAAAAARPLHGDGDPTRSPCASDPLMVPGEVEITEISKISPRAPERPPERSAPPARERAAPHGGEESAIDEVIGAYRAAHFPDAGEPAATSAERAAVRERLREGFTAETLKLAMCTTLPGPRAGGPPPLRWICNPDHLRNHIQAGRARLAAEWRRAKADRTTMLAKAIAPPPAEPQPAPRPNDPMYAIFAAMVPPQCLEPPRRNTA